jgi:hypothetical protein
MYSDYSALNRAIQYTIKTMISIEFKYKIMLILITLL